MAGVVSVQSSVETGHEDMIVSKRGSLSAACGDALNFLLPIARCAAGLLWPETGYFILGQNSQGV